MSDNVYELRPYQKECVDILNNIDSGNHLVAMATGLGKTLCMSFIEPKGRMLILSHREELVNQPVKYFHVPVGFEQADRRRAEGRARVSRRERRVIRRLNKQLKVGDQRVRPRPSDQIFEQPVAEND